MLLLSTVLHFSAAWLMAVVANWIGAIRWRRAAAAHWTERARLLFPARATAGLNIMLIPGILAQLGFALVPELTRWVIPDAIASFLGAVLGCYYLEHEMFPALNFRAWLLSALTVWGLQLFVILPAIAAGVLMPNEIGLTMLLVTIVYLTVHFANQAGMLIRFLRLLGVLKPASVRLKVIVSNVAALAGITVRAAWQFGGATANAFAFPASRELAFSDRLLEICNDEEISAVCAHEMAHLGESNAVLAGRLAGSLYLLPLIFIGPLQHRFGAAGFILPFAFMILIRLSAIRLTRRMEKRADRAASTRTTDAGVDEGAYAGALEKIYRENQVPAVSASKLKAHPDLYDRMLGAGVQPDYPRPNKPNRMTLIGRLYILAFIAATVAVYSR